MTPAQEKAYAQARHNYSNHVLARELDTPRYKGFKLYDPTQGRMGSIIILFTPEGIVLAGDGEITPHGTVSSFGYGLEWFAGKLAGGYLAQKFLQKRWVSDACAASIRDHADDLEKEDIPDDDADRVAQKVATLRELATEIESNGLSEHDVYEALNDLDDACVDDGIPGHTYDHWEVAQLAVVQEKFAALYPKLPATKRLLTDWLQQSENYRVLIERSMEKYSQQLGWGLTGAQDACWVMLDKAVQHLADMQQRLMPQ
jgi:hypothetical protein